MLYRYLLTILIALPFINTAFGMQKKESEISEHVINGTQPATTFDKTKLKNPHIFIKDVLGDQKLKIFLGKDIGEDSDLQEKARQALSKIYVGTATTKFKEKCESALYLDLQALRDFLLDEDHAIKIMKIAIQTNDAFINKKIESSNCENPEMRPCPDINPWPLEKSDVAQMTAKKVLNTPHLDSIQGIMISKQFPPITDPEIINRFLAAIKNIKVVAIRGKKNNLYIDMSGLRELIIKADPEIAQLRKKLDIQNNIILQKIKNTQKKESPASQNASSISMEKISSGDNGSFEQSPLYDAGSKKTLNQYKPRELWNNFLSSVKSKNIEKKTLPAINDYDRLDGVVVPMDQYKEIVVNKTIRLPNTNQVSPILRSFPTRSHIAQQAVQTAATQTAIANNVAQDDEVRRHARLWDDFEFKCVVGASTCLSLYALLNSKTEIKNLYSYFSSFLKK